MPARDEVDVANLLLTKALGDEAGLRALREHPEVPDEIVGKSRRRRDLLELLSTPGALELDDPDIMAGAWR